MVSKYEELVSRLASEHHDWLVTGVAGFIGSNLLETLLRLNQNVVGLDNLSTGYRHNLDEVKALVSPKQWDRFTFVEGDIRRMEDCRRACKGAQHVLHHAALGSVSRSIEEPILTNQSNVDGFLNMLVAARDSEVESFVYAASSSTYGDHPGLPKVEDQIGKQLSPYAVTKFVNELYADVFSRTYGFKSIGLRYFNVFGRRQDPDGAYAAVIPKWIMAIIGGEPVVINGDGETSRDFCFVDNAVQANLLATFADEAALAGQIYNVAVNDRTSLNELFDMISRLLSSGIRDLCIAEPNRRGFRAGDVRHSQADISKAVRLLGYRPTHKIERGLISSMQWYIDKSRETAIT